MPDYRFTVALVLRAPIISQAAGGRTLGVDAAALRAEDHPALPGSLIRGNLRHAWERFAKSASGGHGVPSEDEIRNWLGYKSKDNSNDEPWRAQLQFAPYWKALAGSGEGTRHRIKLNPEKGTVEDRHLQTIESPFPAGAEVASDARASSAIEASPSRENQIWTPADTGSPLLLREAPHAGQQPL